VNSKGAETFLGSKVAHNQGTFTTVLTTVRQWSLSRASSIQSTPSLFIIIYLLLQCHFPKRLDLQRCVFHSAFPTKTVYAFPSLPCMLHAPSIISSLVTQHPVTSFLRANNHLTSVFKHPQLKITVFWDIA
jgi:hypothetical protein